MFILTKWAKMNDGTLFDIGNVLACLLELAESLAALTLYFFSLVPLQTPVLTIDLIMISSHVGDGPDLFIVKWKTATQSPAPLSCVLNLFLGLRKALKLAGYSGNASAPLELPLTYALTPHTPSKPKGSWLKGLKLNFICCEMRLQIF
jgi:hypothetical protein